MSLTPKRRSTEKSVARSRQNGRKSRGAVTPQGKARAARANLRHGFYAHASDEVLLALGDDPAAYHRLVETLDTNLAEGLRGQLVERIASVLLRMGRAERIQDGLTLKRLRSGLEMEDLVAAPRLLEIHHLYESLCAIGRMLSREDSTPAAGEVNALVNAFGATPPDDVRELFPLLRSFAATAEKALRPANASAGAEPASMAAAEQEREAARQKLEAALHRVIMPYARQDEAVFAAHDKIRSPENIAALMAPRDDRALSVQKMEDSNLRQLWRLTNILVKIRDGALT